MNNDQMSLLAAALHRAAATMSGRGLVPPSPFGGPGMFNPTPMANQGQPGMQPATPDFASRFGGMQDPAQPSFAERFGNMDPAVLAKGDMLHADPSQAVANRGMPTMAAGVPMPQPRPQMAQAPVPMPQPRPAQAPQEMNFFQRNAAMMHDPVTGMFIDPSAASQAQNSGNIIQKMMGLLHNKANNA